MPETTQCPIDEHDCPREDCLRNPDFPKCDQSVDKLAQLTVITRQMLNLAEANIKIMRKYRTDIDKLVLLVANELGIDRDLFEQRIEYELERRRQKRG